MRVKKQTLIRTMVATVALINNICALSGKSLFPFSEDEVYLFSSALLTVATTLWSWWKNNSFTQSAIIADQKMEQLRLEERQND